ncbi:hypothetical protein EV702DRAFT_1096125 [Suillus placidus]|uniref:Uncharacterized protein n=1 Tax=Suillus placidus TaxID=48579 RepID=A0A9P6ZX33_9AGAM|nr:hypothetical protein EV702DRAFT_1096125 [Suillus placidus]
MIPNSVSALKARRRANIPELPPELWEIIFDHATYVPDIFIPEIYEHSGTLGFLFNRDHHPLIRRSLVTRRYLVRVCKKWWHLATPFLYRSIFIGRGRCLSSLVSALAFSARGKGVVLGERPLGSFTERLDIAMRDQSQAHGDTDLELLAEVIRCLPNLAIVSVDVTPTEYISLAMPDIVMDALVYIAPKLKIIDWASGRLLPPLHRIHDLVTATRQLRILHCPYFLPGRTTAKAICTLSSCTTLGVPLNAIFYRMALTQLPALRELSYQFPFLVAEPLFIIPFLETHGSNLSSVHLSWPGCSDQMNVLATHCPHLRRLTINLDHWESFDAESFKLIPIEFLGLRCRRNQSSTKAYKLVISALARFKDEMPALRTIRFTSLLNVNDLLKNHCKALAHALELFKGSKLRLEDHEGRLLSERVVPLYVTS